MVVCESQYKLPLRLCHSAGACCVSMPEKKLPLGTRAGSQPCAILVIFCVYETVTTPRGTTLETYLDVLKFYVPALGSIPLQQVGMMPVSGRLWPFFDQIFM